MARIPDTIASNATTLSLALETTPGVIPSAPGTRWLVQEPNEYGDFGAELELVARNPINADRRRKKGTIVGLSAAGGWTTDLTARNLIDLMAGFLYAPIRDKNKIPFSAIVSDGLTIASPGGAAYVAGTLVAISGSDIPSNNGLKLVAADSSPTKVFVAGLTPSAQPGVISRAGFEFDAGDAAITIVAGRPVLATPFNPAAFGLNVGEIVYLGGDEVISRFASASNTGFARVYQITANSIVFDKTDAPYIADNGAGKKIRLFFGTVVKDERAAEQVFRTYTLRRTLGRADLDDPRMQSETLVKSVPNEITFSFATEDKITAELSFMSGDYSTHKDDSLILGAMIDPEEDDAINTANDLTRIVMNVYDPNGATAPAPIFAAFEEIELTVNNNVSDNKALGHLGSYALTPGMLEIGGDVTAYFASVDALQAIRDNSDVTLMIAAYKGGRGVAVDLPMIALGSSGNEVSQDDPVMLPIDNQAATGRKYSRDMDHTMLMVFFDYLPRVAGQ